MKNKISHFMVLALLALSACGANIKGETQKWTKLNTLNTELSQKWPNIKTTLDTNQATAKLIWDEAGKLTDEDAKAEKMKSANAKADELLNKVRQVRDRMTSVQKTMDKISKKRIAKSLSVKRTNVLTAAGSTLTEVNQLMLGAENPSAEDLTVVSKNCVSKLISTAGSLKRFEKSIKGGKVKKKKKKKTS